VTTQTEILNEIVSKRMPELKWEDPALQVGWAEGESVSGILSKLETRLRYGRASGSIVS
jgi:hypothetical protein